MYRNGVGIISSVDQFPHMLPPSIWHITTPRYYFLGTAFTETSLHQATTFLRFLSKQKLRKKRKPCSFQGSKYLDF